MGSPIVIQLHKQKELHNEYPVPTFPGKATRFDPQPDYASHQIAANDRIGDSASHRASSRGECLCWPRDRKRNSYTGCINTGGTIYYLALCNTLMKQCLPGHLTVHLSGGDITGVIAGTGLSGGGTEGTVSLAVDTSQVQMRVSGDCSFAGGAISKIDETGEVNCSAGPAVFYLSHDGTHDVSDDVALVGSLSLPPGKYLINAKINFDIEAASVLENYWGVFCQLRVEPGDVLVDVSSAGGDTDIGAAATLSNLAVIDLQAPRIAELWCGDGGDTVGAADFEWTDLKISAIQLGASQ